MNHASLVVALGSAVLLTSAACANEPCLEPPEPFPYRLERTDPLYAPALEEYRRYLDEMEDYVNCLDRERFVALSMFQEAFKRFGELFGSDANFEYDTEGRYVPPDGED